MIYKHRKDEISAYETTATSNKVDVDEGSDGFLCIFAIRFDASNILNASIVSKISEIFYNIHESLEEFDESKIAKGVFKDLYNISSIFSFIENNLDTSINIDVKGDYYNLKVTTLGCTFNCKQIIFEVNKSSDLFKLLSYNDFTCECGCKDESADVDDKDEK